MSSSSPLEDWLAAVVATPGLTALRDPVEARRVLLDDSLAGVDLVARFDGAIVDVGSGGGAPGIPLAHAFPDARGRAARGGAPQVRVPRIGRAAERASRLGTRGGAGDRLGRSGRREGPRPAADGGRVVPAARTRRRSRRALGRPLRRSRTACGCAPHGSQGELEDAPPEGFAVIRKTGPTPAGFPRRTGRRQEASARLARAWQPAKPFPERLLVSGSAARLAR